MATAAPETNAKPYEGPYKLREEDVACHDIDGPDGLTLATVYPEIDPENNSDWLASSIAVAHATARLFTAAPEMLAALKAMVEHYGDHDDDFSAAARTAARAAIAKAEGR